MPPRAPGGGGAGQKSKHPSVKPPSFKGPRRPTTEKAGDKKERGIRRDKAFWTVVLPLVNQVKQHPGWMDFHKDPSWTERRKDLEAQAVKEVEKIMGPHIGFYAAKKGGVSAFFSTLKGKASSPAHANCPPLQPGKAIIDNGGTKLDATQKSARQVAICQVGRDTQAAIRKQLQNGGIEAKDVVYLNESDELTFDEREVLHILDEDFDWGSRIRFEVLTWRLDELSAQQRDFHGKAQCLPAKEKLLLDTLQSDLLAHQVTVQALKTVRQGRSQLDLSPNGAANQGVEMECHELAKKKAVSGVLKREAKVSRARELSKVNNPTTAEKKELEELLKKSHVHNRVEREDDESRARKLSKINNPTTAEKKELEELLKKSHVHNRLAREEAKRQQLKQANLDRISKDPNLQEKYRDEEQRKEDKLLVLGTRVAALSKVPGEPARSVMELQSDWEEKMLSVPSTGASVLPAPDLAAYCFYTSREDSDEGYGMQTCRGSLRGIKFTKPDEAYLQSVGKGVDGDWTQLDLRNEPDMEDSGTREQESSAEGSSAEGGASHKSSSPQNKKPRQSKPKMPSQWPQGVNKPRFLKEEPHPNKEIRAYTIGEMKREMDCDLTTMFRSQVMFYAREVEDAMQEETDNLPFGLRLHRRAKSGAYKCEADGMEGFLGTAGIATFRGCDWTFEDRKLIHFTAIRPDGTKGKRMWIFHG